jgi:hypothetical protein
MKVDAKLAKLVPLMHKFAKQRYFRKFRNECDGTRWGLLPIFR